MNKSIPTAFISYSHKDEKFIKSLTNDLSLKGIQYWLDVKDVLVGDSITDRVENGLRLADYFLLCISRASIESRWVLREYHTALNMQLGSTTSKPKILPILLDKCELPTLLQDIRYADFSLSYVRGFADLCQTFGVKTDWTLPYKRLIDHIESLEPLETFVRGCQNGKHTDLDHEWAYRMFEALKAGVENTKALLEDLSNAGYQIVEVEHKASSTATTDFVHVILSEPIGIHGDFDLTYTDTVIPSVGADSGFDRFIEKLQRYREEILSLSLYLLPRKLSWEIVTFPDGFYDESVDIALLISKIRRVS